MASSLLSEPGPVAEELVREEPLYEVVHGRRVELPPMGIREGDIASKLGRYLGVSADTQQLGWVEVEVLFLLPLLDQQRRPDVTFVSYQRWPRKRPLPQAAAWPVAPDLAVEVVSPNDLAAGLLLKVQEYFQAGVQQVWVVWPGIKQVYVFESPTQVRILTENDELTGGTLLPDFRLPVAKLFEAAVEEEG